MSEQFLKALFPLLPQTGNANVVLRDDAGDRLWPAGQLPPAGTPLLFAPVVVNLDNSHGPLRLSVRNGADLDEVLFYPLPPTAVTKCGPLFRAYFLTSDDLPVDLQYKMDPVPGYTDAGELCRLLDMSPETIYTVADLTVAAAVPPATTTIIRKGIEAMGGQRIKRELAVIHDLRLAGLSVSAIFAIFDRQPIGNPYAEHGSLVGMWTIVDELVTDVLGHLENGKFIWLADGKILWFHLPSVLRWWYPFRRENGQRILPETEMRLLLAAQSVERRPDVGHYIHLTEPRAVPGLGLVRMFGVDIERATRSAVVKGGEIKGTYGSEVQTTSPKEDLQCH